MDADALDLLKGFADGDGRRFLNLLEQVTNAASGAGKAVVDGEFAKLSTSPSLRRFDKGGDEFYWQLSAFHKSLRGSDPDAALYWLARILDGSGDVSQVTRRMIVVASEDIGNADPQALQLALNAALAYERLGSPEGEIPIAHAATYLAAAPKSNAAYAAWNKAKAFVKNNGSLPVPLHLRNAPTKLMQQMGYHEGYRYAHDEPNGYAAGQSYFPEGVARPGWYQPTDRGVERRLGERLTWLRSLDDGTLPEAATPPSLGSTSNGSSRISTAPAVIERVERDLASAVASGAHATPTFFVEGRRLRGSYDARTVTAALEASRRGPRTQEVPS
ncbi:hypothetical protein CDEF62S_04018 [Castellaniella defragrans]